MKVNTPTITMRSYLSTQHLWMAEHCSRYAHEYEEKYCDERAAFHIHLRGHVMTAVTESVAFIEALINELFTDVFDNHADDRLSVFHTSARSRMRNYWRVVEQGKSVGILAKCEMARLLNDVPLLSAGSEPHQSVKLLIALRNWQVHYYPSNVSDVDPHKLQLQLENKFAPNSLMLSSGNAWFPDKALGAACASWAVKSAVAFADEFLARSTTSRTTRKSRTLQTLQRWRRRRG